MRLADLRVTVAFPNHYDVLVLREPKTVFRACFGDDEQAVRSSFRSNFETGRAPHPADLHATIIRMAVSVFEDSEVPTRFARKNPRRIGTHVAKVGLVPGRGVCLADTSGPGHWSIWGTPEELAGMVVDVAAV